ncbi:cysteine hydrolase family protein [Niallia nealsonii]|uniref:Cysteine hydrolase n=1 Tax=Niallia nealsonii TaxID=115979 RepID=A0A2N0Z4B3_9BACI|nr:isochorismatase family cysteine hydrolase [Niallia nealsonii]PKG24355.1 cysteine hydrolase [Niallia nealsonii]
MNQHLNPNESALILVDIQNDFCHEEGACSKMGRDVSGAQAIIPQVELLMENARELNIPIVFIQMTQNEYTISDAWTNRPRPAGYKNPLDICKKDSWGAEFYKIAPKEGDIIVEKHRYSAFIGTDLDMILRNLNCKSIILTGVATNVCVESTARDGFMLDYHVAVVKDASAGYVPALHEATFGNIENNFGLALETNEIINFWSTLKSAAV